MQNIDLENFNIVKKNHAYEIKIIMKVGLSMTHSIEGAKSDQALRMNSKNYSQNL